MITRFLLLAGLAATAVAAVRRGGSPADAPATTPTALPGAAAGNGRAWGVAMALCRVEGRRLLCSPLVLAGFALAPLTMGFGFSETSDLHEVSVYAGFGMLAPAAMTLVTANLAVLRSRRAGTEEVLGVAPAAPAARTGGHLLAVAWPAAAAATVIGLQVVFLLLTSETRSHLEVAELVVGVLLVAGAGALGVLVARWVPNPVAAIGACVAIAVFELSVNGPELATSGWRWMAFWLQEAGEVPSRLLPDRPAGWHAVYLAGLVAAAGVGALARHGLRPRLVAAGGVVVAVVAGAAWAQGRPPSAAAWARADARLAAPDDHQVCEVRGRVRYCAYPPDDALFDHWAGDVAGVLRLVPAEVGARPLEVSQRLVPTNDLEYVAEGLHRRLRRRMPSLPALGAPAPDDGALHPPMGWDWDGRDGPDLGLAFGAASWAIGLPLAPSAPFTMCDGAGQGRTVVAAWLAGAANDETGAALRRHARQQAGGTHVALWESWEGAVALGEVEVAQTLALLDRPPGEVAALVSEHWDQITDRDATTSAVAARLGLPAAAAPAARRDRPTFGDEVRPDLRLGPPCR